MLGSSLSPFFLLAGLIALVAGGYWWGSRSRKPKPSACNTFDCRPDYFKGLNYLLNEQQDKAIDVFVRMVEVDSDTVETHLTLGSLFRRRGEVERAIRIHQNLIARPTLSKEQRVGALLELGLDYMRAGLFDRAENLFREVVDSGLRCEPALRQLIVIYQQEKDWARALECTKGLKSVGAEFPAAEAAQFHCQLAESALEAGRAGQARTELQAALAIDRRCLRALLMLGKLEREDGKHRSALRLFEQSLDIDLDYSADILSELRDTLNHLGRGSDYRRLVERYLKKRPNVALLAALIDEIAATEGEEAAAERLIEAMRESPSLEGVAQFVRLHDINVKNDEFREVVGRLLENLRQANPAYRCDQCGYPAAHMHWQCPGCKSWSTIKPVRECTAQRDVQANARRRRFVLLPGRKGQSD